MVQTPFLNTFTGAGLGVGWGWNQPEKSVYPPDTGLGRKLSSKSMMESLELLEHTEAGLDTPEKNVESGLGLGLAPSSTG